MQKIIISRPNFSVKAPGFKRGKAIMCLDTGEVYTSAVQVCDGKGFNYPSFTRCLRLGKRAEDDRLYCYIADMAYYANEIQQHIYDQARLRYDHAKTQLLLLDQRRAELQTEMENLQKLVG